MGWVIVLGVFVTVCYLAMLFMRGRAERRRMEYEFRKREEQCKKSTGC